MMDNAETTSDWRRMVTRLNARAARLRTEADELPEPIAVAYRRRASELDLQAFALTVRLASDAEVAALAA